MVNYHSDHFLNMTALLLVAFLLVMGSSYHNDILEESVATFEASPTQAANVESAFYNEEVSVIDEIEGYDETIQLE